jgi:thiosulfate/3-mercaptopyruvate sulfurtransferase
MIKPHRQHSNAMSSIIRSSQLQALLATSPPTIIDCQTNLTDREASLQMYRKQHIPGAVYTHLEDDLSGDIVPGKTGRHPLPSTEKLQALLRRLGIEHHTHVVIYDQGPSMFAARAWWLLKWSGIETVQVLDGGLEAWQADGGSVTTDIPQPAPSDITIKTQDDWIVSLDELASSTERYLLLDARAMPRYLGKSEPLDNKAGHIPGAWNADFMANLREDKTFRDPAELRQRFAPLNDAIKPVVCYCGSGVTACHNLLAIAEAGLTMPKLYPGSWSEWSLDDARPIATAEEGIQL